jgi:hypothetical protein
MNKRRNFTKAVRVEIRKRGVALGLSKGFSGPACERCGLSAKKFEVNHRDMDAMQIDKRRKLTADDGELLCADGPNSCHKIETRKQMPVLVKARKREASHLGDKGSPSKKIESAGFKKSEKAAARAERGPKIAAAGMTNLQRRFR